MTVVAYGFPYSSQRSRTERPDKRIRTIFEVCGLNPSLRTPAHDQRTFASRELTPSVTVVICTRNRPAFLQKCLAGIARLKPAPNQVLVIDNSAGNADTRKVASDYGARYIIEPVPGLSHARNRGLAECSTEIVAFLDDDAVPAPEWLGALVASFADKQIAAATGKVFSLDGDSSEAASQNFMTLSSSDSHWFERATFGGMGVGCNMALRREACIGWNVFDERLGRGAPFHIGEESFAFASFISRGYTAVYLPSAAVYHATHKRDPIEVEARNSLAYWLLLFSEFPGQRLNLVRFLFRRLSGKRLDWPRNPQDPGEIVSSSWHVKLRAGWNGLLLFLRTPKP